MNLTKPVLDPLETQAVLVHELGHSLFVMRDISLFDQGFNRADPETVQKFHDACNNLRDFAIDDLEKQSGEFVDKLNTLSRLKPDIKPAADYLISAIKDGTLNDLFAGRMDKYKNPYFVPACIVSSGSELLTEAAKAVKITYDFVGAGKETMEALDDIETIPEDFARTREIYKAFTEATYVLNKAFGHPEDGLDEAAASMFDLTMLFAEKFGKGISSLPSEQKKAILDLYTLVMNEYYQVSPAVDRILRPMVDTVLKAAV